MIQAILLIMLAAIVAHVAQGIAYMLRHEAAKRRARNEVFPPLRVLEVQDEIPF